MTPSWHGIVFAIFMKPCFSDFMKAVPAAVENDALLQIQIPAETKRALLVRAAETGTPMRMLVLAALREAGFPVAADALVDRRKAK